MAEETGHVAKALEDQPEVPEDLFWVWRAFWILSRTRGSGFSSHNPISLTEISTFCDFFGYDYPENRYFLFQLITGLDSHFLKLMHEQRKATVSVKQ